MQNHIAIYRPDDIPSNVYGWDVSFDPIFKILEHIGLKPILRQRRLHPDWRTQDHEENMRVFDVVEIPARQYSEHRQHLESLGFEQWPEEKDVVSSLYEIGADDENC